jgi:hypothetical protein
MERRDFLKLASMTGLAVVAGGVASNKAKADAPYDGPLWLMCHLPGGWDVTSTVDPKGSTGPTDPDPMNHYLTSQIQAAGNIKYAPLQYGDINGMAFTASDAFFQAHYQDITIVNGIDNATNSHDAGTRVTWAGNLAEGKPTVAALIAAAYLPTAPMSFITFGGYDTTDGVVGASRLGNIEALKRIAYPYEINYNETNPDNIVRYHTEATQQRISDARKARYDALMKSQRLPRVQTAMSHLYTARLGSNELDKLTANLPDKVDGGLLGQAELAIAAYKSGLCVSANLQFGGWDSHGDNDRSVAQNLQGNMQTGMGDGLWGQLDAIMTYAKSQGVDNNMVICIGSDFGRTPGYNGGNGKDHWSITSMMIMGAIRGQKILGNRVIGMTDERHNPINIDPNTLQADEVNGIRITPGHTQRAIRKAAGIDTNPISAMYPVDAKEDLPLFG